MFLLESPQTSIMWQNFRNVGSAMQALGNVVAPPMEDDDEDDYDEGSYYEDEDGEELEEADDINSQEHEDDVLHSHSHETPMVMAGERISPLKTGLGFVGMIARALDRNEEEEEDGSYEEYEDDEGEEVVELYSEELPDTTQQITIPLPTESTESKIPLPTEPPIRTSTPPRQPQDDGWGDIHTTWEVNNETFQVQKDDSISEMNDGKTEQRRSIQRETGSVSPITSSKKSLLSSSSPMGTSATAAESSTAGITENLKAQFPELPIEPESSAAEPSKQILVKPSPDSENDVVSRVVDKQLEYATKSSRDLPEMEAPAKETSPTPRQASWPGSNNSSKKDGASPRERRGSYKLESESKGQQRRSSKVSLSDARFLAELPRAEDLETADRWGAPKSTSMRNKPRSSSTKDNQASRHSLDSYFDDSSLSSVSTRGRKDRRKSAGSPSKVDLNMHLSASSPTLDDTQNLMQEDKSKKSTQQAEARFRTEPARTHPTELPARDMRFASTKSHVAPPPEPQRQASRRQWSDGSARNKAEIIKSNIIETGQNSAEFENLVTEAAGSVDPPRNPIRKGSGDQTPMIPEAEPRMGRRPPLVTGNSKDGDIVPRRPVQRMPSHNEERANTEEKSKHMYPLGTTATMNGIHSSSPDENKRLAEFQQRCLDLEAKLKEALDTKEMVEQKLEQEEAAREEQLNAFREKEARFFDASAEAQEQMMRELNAEMERRVTEVSSLLEDQQRQHEVERAEWQAMLKDAEDRLQSASSGGGITDEVSNMMEDQQRQHESDRAEWQELLSEAEDQIKTLKMDTSESVSSMLEDKERQHEQDRAEWQESLSQAKAEIDSLKKSQGDGKADTPEQAATMMKDQQRRHEEDRAEWQELLGDARKQLEKAQKEKREVLARLENANTQNQQRQDRAVRIAEDKLAQTLAILDEREEQISQLKNMVKSMSDEVHEHREGVQEVEDEADELRHQNEVLQHRLETVETQRSELHEELQRVQGEIDKMANLKVRLHRSGTIRIWQIVSLVSPVFVCQDGIAATQRGPSARACKKPIGC